MQTAVYIRGITKIELPIVIFVLTILIIGYILYPVFDPHHHGNQSHQTACMNHQRQLATAIMMYVQDNDDTFFPDPKTKSWATCLSQYDVKSIYDCPSQKGKGTRDEPDYGFFVNLFGIKLNDIKNPSVTMLTVDRAVSRRGSPQNCTIQQLVRDIDCRHNNRVIMTFADGHVEGINVPQGSTCALELASKGINLLSGAKLLLHYPGEITAFSTSNAWSRAATTIEMPVGTFADTAHLSPVFKMTFELNGIITSIGSYSCSAVGFHVPKTGVDDEVGFFIGHLGMAYADRKVIGQSSSKQHRVRGGFDVNSPSTLGPGIVGRTPYHWNSRSFTRFEVLVAGDGVLTRVFYPPAYRELGKLKSRMNTGDEGSSANRYLGVYQYADGAGSEKATMRNLKIYGYR